MKGFLWCVCEMNGGILLYQCVVRRMVGFVGVLSDR